MWRNIASNALTLLIVALVFVAGVISWGAHQYRSDGPLDSGVCLRVERGATLRRVTQNLSDMSAVSSSVIFSMGAEYTGRAPYLKAGSFLIPAGASMEDITTLITSSGQSTCGTEIIYRIGVTQVEAIVRELDPKENRFVDVLRFDPSVLERDDEALASYQNATEANDTRFRVTVAEGVTTWRIVQSLKAIDVLGGENLSLPEEGALAPQSYEFSKGESVSDLLERMSLAQSNILNEQWSKRAENLPISTPQEALILASIVEKETGQPEERGQVASVFINRLRQGMKLQTDPTVIYGLTAGKEVLGRGLRRSELKKETAFNTYVIEGLPPTPIANPGKAAIEAALNPEKTNFIFFVADGTGGHAFAQTLGEHNANVAKWRKIEAEKNKN